MATERKRKEMTLPGRAARRGNDSASQVKRKGREKEKRVPFYTSTVAYSTE